MQPPSVAQLKKFNFSGIQNIFDGLIVVLLEL
jgi:hypothetical protein